MPAQHRDTAKVPLSAGVALVLKLLFAIFGAMFFITFFLKNAHGLGAIPARVRLLPVTGMSIVASPPPAR
jgi:hypothetical protein